MGSNSSKMEQGGQTSFDAVNLLGCKDWLHKSHDTQGLGRLKARLTTYEYFLLYTRSGNPNIWALILTDSFQARDFDLFYCLDTSSFHNSC